MFVINSINSVREKRKKKKTISFRIFLFTSECRWEEKKENKCFYEKIIQEINAIQVKNAFIFMQSNQVHSLPRL